ncbi:hypothetical protein BDZ91DRAFT_741189, partial [Kalaharituber pfeilii]
MLRHHMRVQAILAPHLPCTLFPRLIILHVRARHLILNCCAPASLQPVYAPFVACEVVWTKEDFGTVGVPGALHGAWPRDAAGNVLGAPVGWTGAGV